MSSARLVSAIVLASAIGSSSCLEKSPPRTPESTAEIHAGMLVDVQIRYRREGVFSSVGRPETLRVISDYRGTPSSAQYPGFWDERAQTLAATVTVPLGAENLVYVVDPAIAPGATTTITAARGRLKDVPCPADVNPLFACELLQVLH
jgi:hypothetical protein